MSEVISALSNGKDVQVGIEVFQKTEPILPISSSDYQKARIIARIGVISCLAGGIINILSGIFIYPAIIPMNNMAALLLVYPFFFGGLQIIMGLAGWATRFTGGICTLIIWFLLLMVVSIIFQSYGGEIFSFVIGSLFTLSGGILFIVSGFLYKGKF